MPRVMRLPTKYHDPLRRLTAMPLVADLSVMGRTLRLESNSQIIFGALNTLFSKGNESTVAPPVFVWHLVGERNHPEGRGWPEMAAFSDDGLRYVNLGQRNFFAVDLNTRKAVAFLSEELAKDNFGFISVFAATLFDLTASALGLVQIGAACVSLREKAVLVIGPPRSGKTTSTYLAGKLGLEFHSDQASYLDLRSNRLRVWGQFWPAAFREESVCFLPELKSATESFSYANLTHLCLVTQSTREFPARSVIPVACVFLERQAAEVPQLIPMAPAEREDRINTSLSFQDDVRFQSQSGRALCALGKLPAYRLPYGDDPAVAATFLRSILRVHNSLEVPR